MPAPGRGDLHRARSDSPGVHESGGVVVGVLLTLAAVAYAADPPEPEKSLNDGLVRALRAITEGRWNVLWGFQDPPDPNMPGELTIDVRPTQRLLVVLNINDVPPVDPEMPDAQIIDPDRPGPITIQVNDPSAFLFVDGAGNAQMLCPR